MGSPEEALRRLARLTHQAQELHTAREEAVKAARAAGASWAEIGRAAGISREAAWQRWRGLASDDDSDS